MSKTWKLYEKIQIWTADFEIKSNFKKQDCFVPLYQY